MSDRGCFATELVYCDDCAKAIDAILCKEFHWPELRKVEWIKQSGSHPEWSPVVARMWSGKVDSSYPGGEIHVFGKINSALQDALCHPLRVVVLAENGDNVVFPLLPIKYLEEHPPAEIAPSPISPLSPHNPLLEIEPGKYVEIPATHLGDKLNVIRFVEGLRAVTYSIPLYVDAEGRLICDSFTKEIPEEAKVL